LRAFCFPILRNFQLRCSRSDFLCFLWTSFFFLCPPFCFFFNRVYASNLFTLQSLRLVVVDRTLFFLFFIALLLWLAWHRYFACSTVYFSFRLQNSRWGILLINCWLFLLWSFKYIWKRPGFPSRCLFFRFLPPLFSLFFSYFFFSLFGFSTFVYPLQFNRPCFRPLDFLFLFGLRSSRQKIRACFCFLGSLWVDCIPGVAFLLPLLCRPPWAFFFLPSFLDLWCKCRAVGHFVFCGRPYFLYWEADPFFLLSFSSSVRFCVSLLALFPIFFSEAKGGAVSPLCLFLIFPPSFLPKALPSVLNCSSLFCLRIFVKLSGYPCRRTESVLISYSLWFSCAILSYLPLTTPYT